MIEQGTAEWMAMRGGRATATRVADLTARTKSGYSASRKTMIGRLVAERLSGQVQEINPSAAMIWGTEKEPEARNAYELFHGHEVELVGFVEHPEIEWAGASPDGLVRDSGLVEFKCPNTATHIKTLRGGPIPDNYLKQMMWQMDCTGREWCDFVSFDPRMPVAMQLHCQRVKRDDEYLEQLRADVQSALDEVAATVEELKEKFS